MAKNVLSKTYGVIISEKTIYPVYYIFGEREKWFMKSEQGMVFSLKMMMNEIGNKEKIKSIFYVERDDLIVDLLFPSEKNQRTIEPAKIYENAYILPLNKNFKEIQDMVITRGWEEKMAEIILEEDANVNGYEDGETDGLKVYNLLGNDVVKIKAIIPDVEANGGVVIIHPWQEEFVDALYKDKIKKVIVNEDVFKSLVESLA